MMTRGFEVLEGGPAITTLGSAGIVVGALDRDATTIGPGKPLALLVYLTASRGRCASREHLIDLLWADAESEAAKGGYYSGGIGGIITFGGLGDSTGTTSHDTDMTHKTDPNDGSDVYDEA